ncbi:LysR family transcriptional regulator [Rhodoligotrophos defluvii]|uniref:LysR family transcriptional regulator n=1 Tax=Rhodoligotrophos defluvii TaxID=2561934 RepID=UPI0010CA18AD|nr:LysR family transcriptional regulator [Rhodoligotrophos defluvii]
MDLRQLRTFIQVAETGSLTRAADRLNTVQPTLSRQIRMLEEEFGTELFERQGRGMKLTEAGDRLLEHARAILREVEHARADLLALRGAITGSVVCGVIPSLGDRALVPFVRSFVENNPLVSLRLVTGYAGFLIEWLGRRQLDIAILYDLPTLSSYDVVPMVEEPLFVVASPRAGLDIGVPVKLATLASVPMVMPSPQHGLRKLVDKAAQRHNVRLSVRVEADSLQTQLELARTGFGWTVLPPSAVAAELADRQISAAPLCEPEVLRRIVLVLPIDRSQPYSVRVFSDAMAEHVLSMVRKGGWPGARVIS